jgi:hypothetical protein
VGVDEATERRFVATSGAFHKLEFLLAGEWLRAPHQRLRRGCPAMQSG